MSIREASTASMPWSATVSAARRRVVGSWGEVVMCSRVRTSEVEQKRWFLLMTFTWADGSG
jgi:hypothetical protein